MSPTQPRSQTATPRWPYFPALDGIRGIAVSAVLAFHGGIAGAQGGYLGVSTFFTLSGFLITSLLLHEYAYTGRIDLVNFWTRRFRRLMPAGLFALGGVALFGRFLATTEQLWRLRADSLAALFYGSNWRFLTSGLAYEDLFGRPSPVQHFWSLSIEEQFYLGFPLLLIGLLRIGRSRTNRSIRIAGLGMAALAGASLLLCAGLHDPEGPVSRVYYGTDTRAAELLIGAVLAFVQAERIRTGKLGPNPWISLAGAGGLFFSVILWVAATPLSVWLFEGGLGLYALASSAVIVAALYPGPMQRLLGFAPLRNLGRISYGVYLYHWPLFLWLDGERTGLGGMPLFVLRVAASVTLAALSFRLLEQPVRSGGWLPRYRLWVAAPVAMTLIAGSLIGVTRNLRVPWHYNHVFIGRRPMPQAKAQDGTPLPKILFLGDSVGWTLAEGIVRWTEATGRAAVWNMTSFGCGVARGGQSVLAPGQPQRNEHCSLWQDWWGIQLDRFKPDVVVMLTGLWDLTDRRLPHWNTTRTPGDPVFDDWLLKEYQTAEDLMASRGARVIWLTHPCISSHPGKNITNGPLGGTPTLDPDRIQYLNRTILPRLLATRSQTMQLLDLFAHLCPAGRFPSESPGIAGDRPDGVHFSRDGADHVARWLGPRILDSIEAARSVAASPGLTPPSTQSRHKA